jgi:hypothetical protein
MPVLAFLCDSERLPASNSHRRLRRPKDMRRQERLNTWGSGGASVKLPTDAKPPPPYGLALLIGMAQMRYHLCSKRSNPPNEYQVCNIRCSLRRRQPHHSAYNYPLPYPTPFVAVTHSPLPSTTSLPPPTLIHPHSLTVSSIFLHILHFLSFDLE